MPQKMQLDRLCIVLVSVRNPLNIGAVARAASNFGFSQLRVVQPYEKAFREARSAVGASELLAEAKEFGTVADAVADCSLVVGTTAATHRDLHQPLKRLEHGAKLIRKAMTTSRVALLFGSERFGLSNSDLTHCQWITRIPTREEHGSMNLGQAVAICLYELIRNPIQRSSLVKTKVAPAFQQERLTHYLLDALQRSGYIKRGAGPSSEDKLRRLIRRLTINQADVETLQGMVRQIIWKIQSLD